MITEEAKAEKKIAKKERERLVLKLANKRTFMAADYKSLIKHTGGLLTQSMVFAYSRALNDVIKLLTKEDENEIVEQKQA